MYLDNLDLSSRALLLYIVHIISFFLCSFPGFNDTINLTGHIIFGRVLPGASWGLPRGFMGIPGASWGLPGSFLGGHLWASWGLPVDFPGGFLVLPWLAWACFYTFVHKHILSFLCSFPTQEVSMLRST